MQKKIYFANVTFVHEPSNNVIYVAVLNPSTMNDASWITLKGTINMCIPVSCALDTMAAAVIVNTHRYRPQNVRRSDVCLQFADNSMSEPCLVAEIDLHVEDSIGNIVSQRLTVYFADIGSYDLILGLPWIKQNVRCIDLEHETIEFQIQKPNLNPSCRSLRPFVCEKYVDKNQPLRSSLLPAVPPAVMDTGYEAPTSDALKEDSCESERSSLDYQAIIAHRSATRSHPYDKSPNGNDRVQATQTHPSDRPDSAPNRVAETIHIDTPQMSAGNAMPVRHLAPSTVADHHIVEVLATKVMRWHARRKLPLKPEIKSVKLMSIRQVSKATKNKRNVFFLATNVIRINDISLFLNEDTNNTSSQTVMSELRGVENPTINFEDANMNENPIDDLTTGKDINDRLREKFKDLDTEQATTYTRILRENASLIPDKLPNAADLRSRIEHHIDLIDGARPKRAPIYHCSEYELSEMKRQITELLEAGHIRHSNSPWAAPVLFVKKKGTEKLRMCIDYRHLNKNTIKDATPLARIDELRQRLRLARQFTALDMMSGYYQIRINAEDVPYTAFNCRYGHFEWLVMPFGLTNAPATFSRWINSILSDLLDTCVVAYLDDILIYSPNEEQHISDVEAVLKRLAGAGAVLNLDKSHFHRTKVIFLGHNVDADGISPTDNHVKAVREWPQIQDKHDLASFCGLVNYFKAWIPNYADIMHPLNLLRKKDTEFNWTVDCQTAIRTLQFYLTTAPVLIYFDPSRKTVLTTDASAFAVGGWLGQRVEHTEGITLLKPVLYYSRKLKDAETRYGTHERELLAIVEMCRVCRPYLEGIEFTVKTDHEALKWLQSQPTLSRRQAAWIERIQAFNMIIEYMPGKLNAVADVLSRRPDYYPNCPRCHAKITMLPTSLVPHPPQVEGQNKQWILPLHATRLSVTESIVIELKNAYTPAERTLIDKYITKKHHRRPTYKWVDGLAYFGSRAVVPQSMRQKLMYTIHDLESVHAGTKKTIDLLQRSYYWPGMGKDVMSWVKTCDECQRKIKNRRHGLLRPLEIPQHRFTDLAMDWADAPNVLDGYDQILIVIDRLRKYLILIPTKSTATAEDTARVFVNYVVRIQGLPHNIVVDRASVWISKFWTSLCDHLHVKMNITTARHQNANGLAEAAVKTVKNMLVTTFNTTSCKNWIDALPVIQLAYNNLPHTSTGFSPNELTFAENVRIEVPSMNESNVPASDEFAKNIQTIIEHARANLRDAQDQQAKFYNRNRRVVYFAPGDKVLLSIDGLNLKVSPKYTNKYIGPMEVVETLENDNYRLRLPPTLRIHDVFHVSKLYLYNEPGTDSIQRILSRPPPTAVVETDDDFYEVDRIIESRFQRRRRGRTIKEYLVKWQGYDMSETTWEPADRILKDAPEIVTAFENQSRRSRKRTTKKRNIH